ncbi:MAG: DUF2309 domain-containing protein [Methylococcales bacterium]
MTNMLPKIILDDDSETRPFDLTAAIDHISHWLPTQGPIKDFIHHNTLHAVQHYPFHKGVAVAAKVFGARSYLPIGDYQALYRQGRIKDFVIDWALKQSGCETENLSDLRKKLFDTDSTDHYPPVSLANHGIRYHWLTHLELDLNSQAHPVLFRLLANFLDQGVSRWTLAKGEESFWNCVWRLTNNSLVPLYPFYDPSVRDLLSQPTHEVILQCLQKIVGSEALYEQYLLEMLLAHPGWAGMVRLIELDPKALLERRQITLEQLIAVELVAELAVVTKRRGADFTPVVQTLSSGEIPLLSDYEAQAIVPFTMKVWQEAMEYALHCELLIALQPPQHQPAPAKVAPIAQAFFCIDDRECSLRRYLEELNPAIETFGAAGFFGIDFLYQGFDDAYPVAQCPNIVTPKHLVMESNLQPVPDKSPVSEGLSDLHIKPHSLFRGWLYTQLFGLGYAVRMLWDVFRPSSQLLKIKKLSEVEAHTQLHLLRESDEPTADGKLLGFSITEMADKIEGLLRNIGLVNHFAPIIVVVAHGSSSTNNPHFAAYDCGACSGKPGAPNARAFAWMANHLPVREVLRERGIDIPGSSHFVAALHNTSRDEITYLDKHLFGEYATENLTNFQQTMRLALQKNAFERCRWFELAPQTNAHDDAHQHVMARATSIFEPRPELNHSNNLYCIVGRRALTRDLFLDRRAFLHSYDPGTDTEADVIVRILSAIIPVCGGINLEYLFSRMDNSVYGAGTKLPHNVIGLLGVANGVEGDLRTGLPSQMIEVHEPARLMIVIEQVPELLDKAFAKLAPALKEWLDHDWVRLVACHPERRDLFFYHASGWEAIELPKDSTAPSALKSEQIIVGQRATIPVHVLRRSA